MNVDPCNTKFVVDQNRNQKKTTRPKTIKVLKSTGILFDEKIHTKEGLSFEFINKSTFNKRQKVTVLAGTFTKYDPKIHQDVEIEQISVSALRSREERAEVQKVAKGTSILFDPSKHSESEVISNPTLRKRKRKQTAEALKTVKVLKGTCVLFDDSIHKGDYEMITKSTLSRRQKVTVLAGTFIKYEPTIHQDVATENHQNCYSRAKRKSKNTKSCQRHPNSF